MDNSQVRGRKALLPVVKAKKPWGNIKLKWLPALLAASAGVAQAADPPCPPGVPGELIGYLRWVGEFQIYPSEAAMRRGLHDDPPNCISGVLSGVGRDDLLRRFHQRKVRLVGNWYDWAPIFEEFISRDPFTGGTPVLQNACGGARVFIADEAFPAD